MCTFLPNMYPLVPGMHTSVWEDLLMNTRVNFQLPSGLRLESPGTTMSKLFRTPRAGLPGIRPPRPIAREQDDVDPLAILKTVWRGKGRIIAGMLISGSLAVGFLAFVAVPSYTAWTVVMIDLTPPDVVGFAPVGEAKLTDASITAELEVIKSRVVARQVVQKLSLTDDPEFNAALRPEPWFPFSKQIATAKKRLRAVLSPDPPEERPEDPTLTRTVNALLNVVNVGSVSNSNVFTITVDSTSPRKAALIANTIADSYIEDRLAERFDANERMTRWLAERVSELKLAYEADKRRLEEFDAAAEMTSPDAVALLNLQIKDLRTRLKAAERDLADASATVTALDAVRQGADPAAFPFLTGTATGDALARWAVLSPEQRVSLIVQLAEGAAARQTRGRQIYQALAESIASLEAKLERQSVELISSEQFRRDVEASSLVYDQALTRLKELSVERNVQSSGARVLSEAEIPTEPSSPKAKLLLLFALLVGASGGSVVVIAREGSRSVFRTAEELEDKTDLPVVAEVPILKHLRRAGNGAVLSHQTSTFSEAIRNLRTSVMMAHGDRPPRAVAFTSCMPGEGKTTMSLAFAQSLAMIGVRVLCIDADLRRRSLSIGLGFGDLQDGLAAAAAAPRFSNRYIVRRDDSAVDFIPAGKADGNPADLFTSSDFKQLIKKLKMDYSCVVFDTPPVLVLPDARLISAVAGSLYLVVKWDHTTKWQALDALRDLTSDNLIVNGLVLNHIEPRLMKKYGYQDRRAACGYGSSYAKELK